MNFGYTTLTAGTAGPAFRALALTGSLGLAAAPAMAQNPVPGVIIQGEYEIEVALRGSSGPISSYGCMILGSGGSSTIPSLYRWPGNGHFCNLETASSQALWNIYPIYANGVVRHVIKSKINGNCLHHGNGGKDANPSLYLWLDSTDTHYCGLRTAGEFISNSQAAWDFSELKAYSVSEYGYADGDVVYTGSISLKVANRPTGYLMFSPTPITKPSVEADVSLASFSSAPNNWQLYFFSSSMVPVPIPGSAPASMSSSAH